MMAVLESFGPMGWPLLVCSVLAAAIIAERVVYFISLLGGTAWRRSHLNQLIAGGDLEALRQFARHRKGVWQAALKAVLQHADQSPALREEVASLWLEQHKHTVLARLKWLALIAVVSPLLGLLGTVLGMIEAFGDIAVNQGPVTPAVLASGLEQAMLTTAAGLSIAVPAVVALHALRIFGGHHIDELRHRMNQVHLLLEGVGDRPGMDEPVAEKRNITLHEQPA